MVCEIWEKKLDAYLDGELPPDQARALGEHLRGCAGCAAEALTRVQQKRAVQAAALSFKPDPDFRARLQKSIAVRQSVRWNRFWLPGMAGAMVLSIALTAISFNHRRSVDRQMSSELADLHVATLASANPVDVVSTDRHTVKPWFEGKIPFTFNLPELQGSQFVLLGAKVSYLNQSPGAELIFRMRQHQLSVFIFQDRIFQDRAFGDAGSDTAKSVLSFNLRSWSHNGLRYFVIGDVGAQDLDKLSELIQSAD